MTQITANSAAMLLTNRNSETNLNMYSIFISMLLPSLLITIVQIFSNTFSLNKIYDYVVELLQYYCILKREYTITLSSRRFYNKLGSQSNDISKEKLSVLFYIQSHLDNYHDVYKLEQDFLQIGDGWYDSDYDKLKQSYYSLDQDISIVLKKEKNFYIKGLCWDESVSDEDNKEKKSYSKMAKINHLTLTTNKNIAYLRNFISDCIEYKSIQENKSNQRHIYTYIGEDECNTPNYDTEIFDPYANLSDLVGDNVRFIEKQFEHFQSIEGIEWYEKRNLPYQLTHLYHGLPGTGKSIIASAIAKKYNLHIVRIKLSNIKTDQEFIRVFKNKNFSGKTLEYKDILYLFDEIDVEFEKLLKKCSSSEISSKLLEELKGNKPEDKNNHQNLVQLCNNNTSELSLGTILEEINGINQMYGRKMILITNNYNKLAEIHNGALVRPGRVDTILMFKKCCKKDTIEMLKKYYIDCVYYNKYSDYIQDEKWTPAEISNLCKIHKTLKDFLINECNMFSQTKYD